MTTAQRTSPKKIEEAPNVPRLLSSRRKPLLLLHVCCGPCATHVVELLRDTYHPVGFFYNPNLYPKEEYFRRLKAAARFSRWSRVALWVPPCEQKDWLDIVRGLETEPEGGRRCEICIQHRMEVTAWMAEAVSMQAFGTTLTLSPRKNSKKINKIGSDLSRLYDIAFLEADFKKKDGFAKSVQKSKELGLYRQDYCGCCYSMRGP